MENTKKCPFCAEEIHIDAIKCKHCGSMLNSSEQDFVNYQPNSSDKKNESYGRNKNIAGLLGIFLGGFGLHKFYLGSIGLGILYLLFIWTFIPSIAGFIEGIVYFSMTEEDFNKEYNTKK